MKPTKNDPAFLDAQREVAEIENALFDGFRRKTAGGGEKSALREAADRLGTNHQSMRNRLDRHTYLRFGLKVDWKMYREPPALTPDDATPPAAPSVVPDRTTTQLKDKVAQLTKALRNAHRNADTADIIREVIGQIADTPRTPPPWVTEKPQRQPHKPTPEVPIFAWADIHGGEVVEPEEVNGFNAYNTEIASRRYQRAVETGIRLTRENHTGIYPGAVINLLGDNVSGGLHPELKATDDMSAIPASIAIVDWFADGIRRMADEFKRLYIPCVSGNHGRNTAKPEFKKYYQKNFDWLIYQMLRRHFADDKRIQFDIRPSNDVHYRVFNERYLALHGDMLGVKGGDGIIGSLGPIMRGEVKKSGQASAFGLSFDKLVMGHWHQRLWLPRAIVAGTLKGFDEYAKNQLGAKPDRPTQPLWFVHPSHGQTAHWDIYVDDPPKPSTEWVSWRNGEPIDRQVAAP